MNAEEILIVGNIADNPFVADIAQHLNQAMDYSDLISLKSFQNTEFCPRFLVDESDWEKIGNKLEGKTVIIASTTYMMYARDDLAMRNFLVARAAKDNGAQRVILLEPDLFYSAQDRGPRSEHGITESERKPEDYKKFDGQPYSAKLYAELLKASGVDSVITVHNHSHSVHHLFNEQFAGHFYDLRPSDLFAQYIQQSDIVNLKSIILCAPDKGAVSFVNDVNDQFNGSRCSVLTLSKERKGEDDVRVEISPESEVREADIAGRDIVVLDDMVRTGSTIIEACAMLKKLNARKIVFFVTHFYSSQEIRSKLNLPVLNEIVTTSTIPQILNRDLQGRLRHKMVVLRIARWISNFIHSKLNPNSESLPGPYYVVDMSSKNPRWKSQIGPLFNS